MSAARHHHVLLLLLLGLTPHVHIIGISWRTYHYPTRMLLLLLWNTYRSSLLWNEWLLLALLLL